MTLALCQGWLELRQQHRVLLDHKYTLRIFRESVYPFGIAAQEVRTAAAASGVLTVPGEYSWGCWDVSLVEVGAFTDRQVSVEDLMAGEVAYTVPAPTAGVSELRVEEAGIGRLCQPLRGLDRGLLAGMPAVKCVGDPGGIEAPDHGVRAAFRLSRGAG